MFYFECIEHEYVIVFFNVCHILQSLANNKLLSISVSPFIICYTRSYCQWLARIIYIFLFTVLNSTSGGIKVSIIMYLNVSIYRYIQRKKSPQIFFIIFWYGIFHWNFFALSSTSFQ